MTQSHSPSPDLPSPSRITARLDRPVVLVGLMGVGKTTVGRRLAEVLKRSFVDVDHEIERAADRSISEIFATHGEAYFREGERRVVARLMGEQPGVIATGGGAFVDPETRALILEKGVAVWLDCDLETLVERTGRRNTRPLLRKGDPQKILAELKEQRSDSYAQAHIHIVTDDGPHHRTVSRILEAIDAWL
ncbi:MAG: shikimate kinase [Erythrobacter sp.]|nr:shikimate kinase [Erythrobacter sp.]